MLYGWDNCWFYTAWNLWIHGLKIHSNLIIVALVTTGEVSLTLIPAGISADHVLNHIEPEHVRCFLRPLWMWYIITTMLSVSRDEVVSITLVQPFNHHWFLCSTALQLPSFLAVTIVFLSLVLFKSTQEDPSRNGADPGIPLVRSCH